MSHVQSQPMLTNHQPDQFGQNDEADIVTFRFLTQHTKEVGNGGNILLLKAVLSIVLIGCTNRISLGAAIRYS